MATLTKPYTFASGGYAVAAQVNADFDTIYGWINGGGAMWNDGSVAFTSVPSGPAADPTSANQLTRKSYVDGKVSGSVNGTTVAGLRVQSADTTFSAASAGTTINFPESFNTVPNVVCSGGAAHGGWSQVFVVGKTVSGFTVKVYDMNSVQITSGGIDISWIAVGT